MELNNEKMSIDLDEISFQLFPGGYPSWKWQQQ